MARFRMMFGVVLVAICSTLPECLPSENENSHGKKWRYVIAGIRYERERLTSGQVLVTGDHSVLWRACDGFRVPVQFDHAFDYNTQLFRFSQSDLLPQSLSPYSEKQRKAILMKHKGVRGASPEGVEWIARPIGGVVVHTPEYDLLQDNSKNIFTRVAPGTAFNADVKEWDVRCFGLLDYDAMKRGYALPSVIHGYENIAECRSIELESSGLIHIRYGLDEMEWDLWIDEKQGMTPIRMRRFDHNRTEHVESSACHVSWKELNGAWVPTSMKIWGVSERGFRHDYEMTLEWSHVNEPLDPKLFTPAGITESKSALVADMRLGPTVVERVSPLPLPEATPKPVVTKPPFRLGWIVLGHLVVGGCLSLWYYFRKTKRQPMA